MINRGLDDISLVSMPVLIITKLDDFRPVTLYPVLERLLIQSILLPADFIIMSVQSIAFHSSALLGRFGNKYSLLRLDFMYLNMSYITSFVCAMKSPGVALMCYQKKFT